MKLIYVQAHGRSYFINPEQITHAEGKIDGNSVYLQIWLQEVKNGETEHLRFSGEDAREVYSRLLQFADR